MTPEPTLPEPPVLEATISIRPTNADAFLKLALQVGRSQQPELCEVTDPDATITVDFNIDWPGMPFGLRCVVGMPAATARAILATSEPNG
jgi:hypothetical protein